MGKKRFIDTDFWTDNWVVETLNPLDCHLFMYLLTNPRTSICGVYELSLRIMSFQIGIEKEELVRMMKRLEPKVFYKNGWVVLVNGVKNQNYKNSKIAEGIRRELCNAPPELLPLLRLPSDLNIDLTCPIDVSSMTHEETSHLTKTLPNLTKPYLTEKPEGFKKNTNPEFKQRYAKAAQADRDLAKRVESSRTRKASTDTKIDFDALFPGTH